MSKAPVTGGISPGCPEHDSRCRPGHCVVATGEAKGAQGFPDARQMIPPPFPLAKDADTEPGIGIDVEKLTLKRENMRLRQERNEARQELSKALLDSVPPPTRKQKTVRGLLAGTKYAVLLPLLAFAGRALARKYPGFQELVDAVLQGLGL